MLDDIQNPAFIKWIGFSTGLGVLISFLFSLIGGAGFPEILYRPLLFGILLGILSAGLFFVIKKFVPEVIQEFQNSSIGGDIPASDMDGSAEKSYSPLEENGEASSGFTAEDILPRGKNEENLSLDTSSDYSAVEKENTSARKRKKDKITDDEIIVHGVSLKNQPQLMADAIRDLMDKDG